jgi:hypothetical protein
LLWLAFAGGRLGLHAVGFALLLGTLQVAALLGEVVAIGLTLEAVKQRGRVWAKEATRGIESTGRGAWAAKAVCRPVAESMASLESSRRSRVVGGILFLCTSIPIPDVLEAGAETTKNYMRP